MSTVVFLFTERHIIVAADSQATYKDGSHNYEAHKIYPLNDKLALFAMGNGNMASQFFKLLAEDRRSRRAFSNCQDFINKMTRDMSIVLNRRQDDTPFHVTFGCVGFSHDKPQCGIVQIDTANAHNPINTKLYNLDSRDMMGGDVLAPADLPPVYCATILQAIFAEHPECSSLTDLIEISNRAILGIADRSQYVAPPVRYWAYDNSLHQSFLHLLD